MNVKVDQPPKLISWAYATMFGVDQIRATKKNKGFVDPLICLTTKWLWPWPWNGDINDLNYDVSLMVNCKRDFEKWGFLS
jgi:hypothetical protein